MSNTSGPAGTTKTEATSRQRAEEHLTQAMENDASTNAGSPSRPAQSPGKPVGPRRVKLTVSKVDPWSVMKLSFLLSVAIGIAMVVATLVIWLVMDSAGVFDTISSTLNQVAGGETDTSQTIMEMFGLGRVISIATVLAIIDVILITAISTLLSLLYNLGSILVGGVGLTLTDD